MPKWDNTDVSGLTVLSDQDQRWCRQAVGKIAWVDRPDLRCGVVRASSRLGRFTEVCRNNLVNLFRYAVGTAGRVGVIRPVHVEQGLHDGEVGDILIHVDADWASDQTDRRSVSGVVAWWKLSRGWYPIQAISRKQSTVSTSSGEAEIVGLSLGATVGSALRNVVSEFLIGVQLISRGESTGLTIGNDSTVALSLAKRKGAGKHTRHLYVKLFHLQGMRLLPKVRFTKVATACMFADMATKVANWNHVHLEAVGLMDV